MEMATAMAGQAVMAAEAAGAVPGMVLMGLVPVGATDSNQREEKGKAQVGMATAERGVVLRAGAGMALATDGAEMAAVSDIMQTSHRKLSEELLRVVASRVREPMAFACQDRSVRSTVRKAELVMAHRLAREPGTLSAAMEREHPWKPMQAAFGLTKTVRNNRQPAGRDRKHGLAAERLLTEQISRAKAAQATSAHGISLAAVKREHRLMLTPEVFGSTKKTRRDRDRRREG
jgi:hypothetical protein